jgi:hypothetical protein
MVRRLNQRGFALPVAIFTITFVTVSLAAAYAMVSSERRVLDNTAAQLDAFNVAQAGLEKFMGDRNTLGFTANPPAAYESTTVSVLGGNATVVLRELRASVAGSKILYVIRSTGVVSGATLAGAPAARRIVAQYAQWQPGTMKVRGGWTSLTGLHKNGNAGVLSGVDRCGASANVAGVSVADPPGWSSNGGFNPTGSPGIERLGTPSQAVDSIDIDWEGIKNKTSFTPDIEIPSGTWPSFADPNYWPRIMVHGNFALPGSGRGILVATGNLTINGGTQWEGLILVGQKMTSNGNNQVYGATVSGLDVMLAGNPDVEASEIGVNAVGNGTKTYQYDSCTISRAMRAYGTLKAVQNAWLDNWASY